MTALPLLVQLITMFNDVKIYIESYVIFSKFSFYHFIIILCASNEISFNNKEYNECVQSIFVILYIRILAKEINRLGINLLFPVSRFKRRWTLVALSFLVTRLLFRENGTPTFIRGPHRGRDVLSSCKFPIKALFRRCCICSVYFTKIQSIKLSSRELEVSRGINENEFHDSTMLRKFGHLLNVYYTVVQ